MDKIAFHNLLKLAEEAAELAAACAKLANLEDTVGDAAVVALENAVRAEAVDVCFCMKALFGDQLAGISAIADGRSNTGKASKVARDAEVAARFRGRRFGGADDMCCRACGYDGTLYARPLGWLCQECLPSGDPQRSAGPKQKGGN